MATAGLQDRQRATVVGRFDPVSNEGRRMTTVTLFQPIATAEKMDELRARVARINERTASIKHDPNREELMPALMVDTLALPAELKAMLTEPPSTLQ